MRLRYSRSPLPNPILSQFNLVCMSTVEALLQGLKSPYEYNVPVTVAQWSKACTVFARLEAGIMGSNPAQGTDVCYVYRFILCVCVCVVLCLGRSLPTS
jgi:hypothetical protein